MLSALCAVQAFDELAAQGFRIRHVSGFAVDGQDRYAEVLLAGDYPAELRTDHALQLMAPM
jgi:hypothetical protein